MVCLGMKAHTWDHRIAVVKKKQSGQQSSTGQDATSSGDGANVTQMYRNISVFQVVIWRGSAQYSNHIHRYDQTYDRSSGSKSSFYGYLDVHMSSYVNTCNIYIHGSYMDTYTQMGVSIN